jgi:hypothetical protein
MCVGFLLLFKNSPNRRGLVDRVKWFRLRALLERAKEERDILDEELDRAWQSFHKSAAIWKSMAAETETEKPGRKAYGEKQCAMYHELAERCFIARGTLPKVLEDDLKKEQTKEAKEVARATIISASPEEDMEDLWETLSKTRLIDMSSTDRELLD